MKRIYLTLGLMLGCAAFSFAQSPKNIDLKIKALTPEINATGDTAILKCAITNKGTDTVKPGDNILIIMSSRLLGSDIYNNSKVVALPFISGITINPDETDTFSQMVFNGLPINGQPVDLVTDTKLYGYAMCFGVDGNGHLFNDPGVDTNIINNAAGPEGDVPGLTQNNISWTIITVGNGSTDWTVKTIDLGIEALDATMSNQGPGEKPEFKYVISNNGADPLYYSDDIHLYMTTELLGLDAWNVQGVIKMDSVFNMNILPGHSDTLSFSFKEGNPVFDDNDVEVNYPNNAKVCYSLMLYGTNSEGKDFLDLGFDPNVLSNAPTPEDWINAFTINNASRATITFGNGEKDLCYPAGIAKTQSQPFNIDVYPNPVNNTLHINLKSKVAKNVSLNILDVTGRVLETKDLGQIKAGTSTYEINVSGLTSGMYFIQLTSSAGVSTHQKFIKK